MSVTITTISGSDSISASRLIQNQNFSVLKNAIEAIQLYMDSTNATISGIKSLTISNSSVSYSSNILNVGKGSALLGNVTMGTSGAATSVTVNGTGGFVINQSSLKILLGSLYCNGSIYVGMTASSGDGNLGVYKECRMPGLSTAYSGISGMTASTTYSVSTLKYLVLRNDSTTSSQTATLSNGSTGQVLEIVHALGASAYPVLISTSNFYGLTGSISLTKTGDSLKCIYDGTSWYMMNYSPVSFATGGTTSSITFTTV